MSGAGTTPAATQATAPPAVPAQIASTFASAAIPAPRVPPAAATWEIAESDAPPWPGSREERLANASCARSSSERETGSAGASAAAARGAAR